MTELVINRIIDKTFGWRSATLTDTGKVRKINEDSCLGNDAQGHWVVADGMGGHQAGDVASQMIVNELEPLQQLGNLPAFVNQVEDTLLKVNARLYELANSRNTVIGSTVVGLIIHQGYALFYWAGDSRGYLLRNGNLLQLTTDHTLVQELVDTNQISKQQALNHPDKNIITRAVGTHEDLFIDYYMTPVLANDIFLVCSDGIEKELTDNKVQNILNQDADISVSASKLLQAVLAAGARDNVSLALLQTVSLADEKSRTDESKESEKSV